MPFAQFTPAPRINVDYSFRHYVISYLANIVHGEGECFTWDCDIRNFAKKPVKCLQPRSQGLFPRPPKGPGNEVEVSVLKPIDVPVVIPVVICNKFVVICNNFVVI